jgi:hypothetical protein
LQITDGWATEYNRKKNAVVLDESDWTALLTDAGVDPETHIPLALKFELLRLQAAVFSLQSLAEYLVTAEGDEQAAPAAAELNQKREQLAAWLTGLKQKYGTKD